MIDQTPNLGIQGGSEVHCVTLMNCFWRKRNLDHLQVFQIALRVIVANYPLRLCTTEISEYFSFVVESQLHKKDREFGNLEVFAGNVDLSSQDSYCCPHNSNDGIDDGDDDIDNYFMTMMILMITMFI